MLTLFLFPFAAAQASGSLSMTPIVPGVTVSAGTQVTFTVTPSGLTDPTYVIDDNFGGTTLTSSRIDASGNFSWTPTSSDIGTHSFTISASDAQGGANLPVTISVSQPTLTLQAPQPSATIAVGSGVTFMTTASGFTNPTYSLSDSFGGGTVSNSNISSSGYFSWNPAASDVGDHAITVTVGDASGHSVTAVQTITVNAAPTLSIQSLSPGTSVSSGQVLSFTVLQSGMTSPSYSVSDSFIANTVSNANINSSGQFSWTPTVNETGTHNLFIIVTDGSTGHTASITETINVVTPTLSIQGATGNFAAPGSTVAFSVSANGYTNPTYTIVDSRSGGTVTNANINSSGYFSWVPQTQDIGGHTLTITISDASGQSGIVSQTVTIQNAAIMIQSVYPSASITVGTPLSFITGSLLFIDPSFTLSDTFSGQTTMTSANISANGNFNWTPKASDVGTHNVRVSASDTYGHSTSTTITILVNSLPSPVIPTPVTGDPQESRALFTSYLTKGSGGAEVTLLQTLLSKKGYFSGTPNGTFGPLTEAAVKRFQSAQGLSALGAVGPQTRDALNKLSSGTSVTPSVSSSSSFRFIHPLSLGSQGSDVVELQRHLTILGDYSGSISGYFGVATRAAVKLFQSKHNLEQLGSVGPGTRAALNKD